MYGKHFASAYSGSLVGSGLNVFAVWGYIIAHTHKSRVEINPVILAAVLGCTVEDVESAIKYLCEPDKRSRNKDHDGKRLIKEGEFQYFVTGHETYRNILNQDERRTYNREKQRECRKKKSVKDDVIDKSALSAHTEADTDTDTNTKKRKTKRISAVWVAENPPTYQDIADFIESKGNVIDAKFFYNYFTDGNWIDTKGNKVYSWKQKANSWIEREKAKTPTLDSFCRDFTEDDVKEMLS